MKKLLLLCAGFCISQLLFAQTPVAYYPFNGNANDVMGFLNGTVNGATLTADRFGNANRAYIFDGVDDFIALNGSFSGFTQITVSAWYKVTAISNDLQAIVSSDNSAKLLHMQLLTSAATDNAVYIDNNNFILLQNTQPILNQWKQVTITAKSGETKLYENGVLISSSNTAFSFVTATDLLRIGSGYLNGRFFNGSIDEVKIYNIALTAQQVTNLYNNIEVCNGIDDDGDGLIDETCIPTVSIANKSINEGNSDTTDMKFAVTLNHPYDSIVSVRYKTANRTATSGSDYVAINKVLKFNPGQVRKNITIGILGDVMPEPNEQFNVILSNPVNTILGTADTALGTIRNDDVAFAIISNEVDELKNIGVRISPNPAKDILQISGFKTDKNSIVITDIQGRIMLQQSIGRGSTTANIAHLSAGMYILTYTEGGAYKSIKILKQ